jgi:hypothetical protein
VKQNIYQSKNNNFGGILGETNESILDVVYRVNRYEKYLNPDSSTNPEINMKMVGLFAYGTDISNDVFEELCDIIKDFNDSITEITLKIDKSWQLEYFFKSINNKK